jgi:hypothetical protein
MDPYHGNSGPGGPLPQQQPQQQPQQPYYYYPVQQRPAPKRPVAKGLAIALSLMLVVLVLMMIFGVILIASAISSSGV